MVNEIRYTSINRVLDELGRHPLLADLSLEQVVSYTLTFIGLQGLPNLYEDKLGTVEIHGFRGILPCDLVRINQVKDMDTQVCLKSMTDNFPAGMRGKPLPALKRPDINGEFKGGYIPPLQMHFEEPSFKTQNRIIYTSFPEGMVEISYKGIPVDDNGFPMVIDEENYLAALRAYIKQEIFQIKFDIGEISAQVLQQAQTEYCWASGRLNTKYTIPSISEMESIMSNFNAMIPKMREFDNGFRSLNQREYLRKQ